MDDYIIAGSGSHLWLRDCLLVADQYPDDYFQLLLTSTPYPGYPGTGFGILSVSEYIRWWYERLSAWITKIDRRYGVIAQNIMFKRTAAGWIDDRATEQLMQLYRSLDLHLIDIYVWDKLNAPPSGNHTQYDRREYEFIYVLARSAKYKFNEYRKPYSKKTIGKAKPGNKPRQTDVRGSHGGSTQKLHPDGARQGNVLRISSSGDQGRPRVKGGVFPRELAERMILTFSDEGDHIVDPCCGSGTVLVEAIKNNRFPVGCDISEKAIMTAEQWIIKTTLEFEDE